MTRFEKLTLGVSILALVGAIASPFISYRWLDPQLQAFQNRARLEVSEIIEPSEAPSIRRDVQKSSPEELLKLLRNRYQIQILNRGVFRHVKSLSQFSMERLKKIRLLNFLPPLPTESSDRDNLKFLTLKQPIAPRDSVNRPLS